jgi:hypothetical protein
MDDKILNPKTGKYVLKTGKIGKLLLQLTETAKSSKTCSPDVAKYKLNPKLYICNPQTGNWVLKTGEIGKVLMAKLEKGKSPKSKPKSPKAKTLIVQKQKSPKPKSPKAKTPIVQKPKSPPKPPPCDPKSPKATNPKYICNPATKIWVMKTSAIGKKLMNANNPNMILNPSTGKYVTKYGQIGKKILQGGDGGEVNKVPKPKIIKNNNQVSTLSLQAIQNAPHKILLPNKKCDPNDEKYKANPDDYVCNPYSGNWVLKNSTKGIQAQKVQKSGAIYNALTKKVVNKNDVLYKVLKDVVASKSPVVEQVSPKPHPFHPESAIFCNIDKYGKVFKKQLQYVASLDAKKLQALVYYTGSGYSAINNFLRGKPYYSDKIKHTINRIDKIFANIPPLENDVVVWRSYGYFNIKDMNKHIEPAYSSVTAKKGAIGGNYIEIHVPKGTKVIPLISCSQYAHEIEVLLPRNIEYTRVKHLNKVDKSHKVDKSYYTIKMLPISPKTKITHKVDKSYYTIKMLPISPKTKITQGKNTNCTIQ